MPRTDGYAFSSTISAAIFAHKRARDAERRVSEWVSEWRPNLELTDISIFKVFFWNCARRIFDVESGERRPASMRTADRHGWMDEWQGGGERWKVRERERERGTIHERNNSSMLLTFSFNKNYVRQLACAMTGINDRQQRRRPTVSNKTWCRCCKMRPGREERRGE